MVERKKAADDFMDQFAKDPAVQAILAKPGFIRPMEDPPAPSDEALKQARCSLSNAYSALALAHSILREEQFRTPVGGGLWETLGGLAGKVGRVMEGVYSELEKK